MDSTAQSKIKSIMVRKSPLLIVLGRHPLGLLDIVAPHALVSEENEDFKYCPEPG